MLIKITHSTVTKHTHIRLEKFSEYYASEEQRRRCGSVSVKTVSSNYLINIVQKKTEKLIVFPEKHFCTLMRILS